MKKVLLGACALSFIASANANVICDEVSYTGLFGGLGVVFSFDKDKADLTFGANSGNGNVVHAPIHAKKNKTAFGGQIVIGYGHQFDNNLYVGIMHESLFASKAKTEEKVDFTAGLDAAGGFVDNSAGSVNYKRSRKCWTPSFGLAMGYVVDGWNFGLRGGISLEKNKIEQIASDGARIGNTDANNDITTKNKSISATSPYVGAYVEYKMGSFIGYLNVDHVFGKNKTEKMGGTATAAQIDVKHKRSSWKAAAGVKFNVNLMN